MYSVMNPWKHLASLFHSMRSSRSNSNSMHARVYVCHQGNDVVLQGVWCTMGPGNKWCPSSTALAFRFLSVREWLILFKRSALRKTKRYADSLFDVVASSCLQHVKWCKIVPTPVRKRSKWKQQVEIKVWSMFLLLIKAWASEFWLLFDQFPKILSCYWMQSWFPQA